MTMTIDASAGITFPDGTQQAKSQQGAAFSVYRSTQSITSGSFVTVACDVEEYDTANAVASGVFTAPVAGYYQFNGLAAGATTPSTTQLRFSKNSGAAFYYGAYMTGTANANAISALIYLAAGDTVALQVLLGTTQNLAAGPTGNIFQGFLARAA